jgi:subtilisin-like proprotein convertase family protein
LDFLPFYLNGNCDYEVLSLSERKAFSDGVSLGRQGKGIIYVFSSGNEFGQGEERSFQSQGQTRFVISVGAVGQDRLHTTYSTPGTSVFIAGPGGDRESLSNHITTGFDRQCSDASVGTSFACPVVSGVIALVLEVNPDLTWRDVQYILAQTSQRVDDSEDTTAFQNAAGYWHSHWYGFGIVNAEAAVTAARDWENVGAEQTVLAKTGLLNKPIVDDESTILETSVTVEAPVNFAVESVELQLNISSFSRGDLEIILTSPQGTTSVLHAGRRPENKMEDSWILLTVRHWGENPNGEWTLTVVDLVKGDVDICQSQNWMVNYQGVDLDCSDLDTYSLCVVGILDLYSQLNFTEYDDIFNHRDNGLLAEEACCACGGGLNTTEVVDDELKQWTLVVYGTDDPVRHPLAPSPAPSPAPGPSSSVLDGAPTSPAPTTSSSPAPGPSSSVLDGASTIFGLTVVSLMGSFVLLLAQ